MNKILKKCYGLLELSTSCTAEDVEARANEKIDKLREKKISNDKLSQEIQNIEIARDIVIEYIKDGKLPEENTNGIVGILFGVLVFCFLVCVISFLAL